MPVLPITVNGSRKVLPKKSLVFHPGTIEVVVSDPIETTGYSNENIQDLIDKTRAVIISKFNPNFPDVAN
jgi:1-acyl-sn-glycerol-3-phosphate acyltransferase